MAPFEGAAVSSPPGPWGRERVHRPTRQEQARVLDWCVALLRAAAGVTAAVTLVLYPPPSPLWPFIAILNVCWGVSFAVLTVRHGLTAPLLICDVALTSLACLHQADLLAPGALAGGVSWISSLVTMSIVGTNLAWPIRRAAPVCCVVILCHLLGSRQAGAADGGITAAGIQTLQTGVLAGLTSFLRRVAELADDILNDLRVRQQRAAEERTRRLEEQRRADELHGTVLATLTAVAGGGVRSHDRLRLHAERAVTVLEGLAPGARSRGRQMATGPTAPVPGSPGSVVLGSVTFDPGGDRAEPAAPGRASASDTGPQGTAVRLDIAVRYVVTGADLRVQADLEEVLVPGSVAETVVTAVEELVSNVRRHAGVDTAQLTLRRTERGFDLEVVDEGVGFDPALVSSHRYGLHHAVRNAVDSVGGASEVRSVPGSGTRVLLRWPR